jgi:intracellular sulfur oxidation DsrE/DsrF family protein
MRILLMSLSIIAAAAGAAAAQAPAVPGFGAVAPVPDAHERPDPSREYKVVFDVSKGAPDAGKPAAGLERVARFVNMLGAGGVPADKRRIVAVLHGPATEAVMTDAAYGRRHGGANNPNGPLIAALEQAGVEVRVCGQALAGQKIARQEVLPAVQVDLAALMTVTHLQFAGYALVVS